MADRDDAPSFRILRSRRTPKYPKPYTCTYVLETEPGVLVPVYMLTEWSVRLRLYDCGLTTQGGAARLRRCALPLG